MRNELVLTLLMVALVSLIGSFVPMHVADRLFNWFLGIFVCGGAGVLVVCGIAEGVLALRGHRAG